eukprot:142820_1
MLVYQRKVIATKGKSRFTTLNEVEACVRKSKTIWSDIINDNKSSQQDYAFVKVPKDSVDKVNESNRYPSCNEELNNCLNFMRLKKTMHEYRAAIGKRQEKDY